MNKPLTRLSDMEYDEVSLVGIPCNQESDIVLFKSMRVGQPASAPITRRTNAGRLALARHAIRKGSPDMADVHEDAVMGTKKKRKKAKKKMDDTIEVSEP